MDKSKQGGLIEALILLICILLGGCAKPHKEVLSIPETFQPIYQRFLRDAKANGLNLIITDLIIQEGNLTAESINGKCHTETNKTPIITINNDHNAYIYWGGANDSLQENLLYHELGHCILLRPHDFKMIIIDMNSIPNSIMALNLINPIIYNEFHEHYITELFQNAPLLINNN